jgi:SAM-dependent methyltransferase
MKPRDYLLDLANHPHLRWVRPLLERLPLVRRIYSGWARTHPIDRLYGTETSGTIPVERLGVDMAIIPFIKAYGGSQPSIVRAALSVLPGLECYNFIDLGCGKGRALIVAAQFPFRRVLGVELSPKLVKIARANMTKVRQRYPGVSNIEVVEDNAASFLLPTGKIVLFIYHSFSEKLITELLENIERGLVRDIEHLFLVYYNPVWGTLFDRSRLLGRWYAEVLPYDPGELGFGPGKEETVVIWQSVRGALQPHHNDRNRRIVVDRALENAYLTG